jgi:TPR repeat protein
MADANASDLLTDQSPLAGYGEADLAAIASMAVHLPLGAAAKAQLDAIHAARRDAAARAKRDADVRTIALITSDTPAGTARFNELLAAVTHEDDTPERAEAREMLDLLSQLKHGPALHSEGLLFQRGLNGKAYDPAHAAKLYRDGVQAGDFDCMIALGDLYAQGLGVERDVAEAMRLYERAEPRSVSATVKLLRLWHKGLGGVTVQHDFRRLHKQMLGLYELLWGEDASEDDRARFGPAACQLVLDYFQAFGSKQI